MKEIGLFSVWYPMKSYSRDEDVGKSVGRKQ